MLLMGSPKTDGAFSKSCDVYMAKPININKM